MSQSKPGMCHQDFSDWGAKFPSKGARFFIHRSLRLVTIDHRFDLSSPMEEGRRALLMVQRSYLAFLVIVIVVYTYSSKSEIRHRHGLLHQCVRSEGPIASQLLTWSLFKFNVAEQVSTDTIETKLACNLIGFPLPFHPGP